jgi:cell division protein FtsQ
MRLATCTFRGAGASKLHRKVQQLMSYAYSHAENMAAQRRASRPTAIKLWLRRSRKFALPGAAIFSAFVSGWFFWGYLPNSGVLTPASGFGQSLSAVAKDVGFVLTDVSITGRENASLTQIREAISVKEGDSILAFSPDQVRERLQALPWIQSARVERRFPGTINVSVVERRPFAIWQYQNKFQVIDRFGMTITADRMERFGPLPLVVGAGAQSSAAALRDILVTFPVIDDRTQALVRIGERRWNLRLHNGTDVYLPEGHAASALARLSELQASMGIMDRPLVAIDMRLPDRLVLRTQPVPEPETRQPGRNRR